MTSVWSPGRAGTRTMSRAVSEGFRKLLQRCLPLDSEVNNLKSHYSTIKQALNAEFRNLNKVELFGSHRKKTAIRRFSDVDYLAVIGKADLTWGGSLVRPETALNKVKRSLGSRYFAYGTRIRIDGPAVVVHFSQGAVDVVPGFWNGTTGIDGYPVFAIPDGIDWWRNTSPQRHRKYISEEDQRSGHMLSPTIRLLKVWKYSRKPAIPFLGFHAELLLASEGICTGARTYSECMLDAFRLLRSRGGRAFNDPLGISPRIPAAYTEVKRKTFAQAADYAADHAARAVEAEIAGYDDEAYRQWDIVFGGSFPARR